MRIAGGLSRIFHLNQKGGVQKLCWEAEKRDFDTHFFSRFFFFFFFITLKNGAIRTTIGPLIKALRIEAISLS